MEVPVMFMSYSFSGNTHSFGVGDTVCACLVFADAQDGPVPERYLVSLDVEAEWSGPYGEAFVRAPGLFAYWDPPHSEPPRRGAVQGWLREQTHEPVPDDMEQSCGVVTALDTVSIFYPQVTSGARTWRRVMAVDEVTHTDENPLIRTVLSAGDDPRTIDFEAGAWWHAGWFATLRLDGPQASSSSSRSSSSGS